MDWRTYEDEIYEHLCGLYPNAAIRRDVQLAGRDSNVDRQIDILIEDTIVGFNIRIVVDGKCFARRIDVTHVERFIALVEDVRATHGLMVTSRGYSKAALRRAHNYSKDIQLDVLNLSELREYQSLAAIPYLGNRAMWVNAPFGWIIDGSRNDQYLAALYQRGRSLQEAMRRHDWMYVNYWRKDAEASSLPEGLKMQTREMAEVYDQLEASDCAGPSRHDGRATWVRVATYDDVPFKEVTGYIDGDDIVAFFVLFTVPELEATNTRKLMHVLKYSMHCEITFQNERVISALKKSTESTDDPVEKARSYTQIAIWYAEMGDQENAAQYFRRSFYTSPTVYRNFRPLMIAELSESRTDEARKFAKALFRLDPENPRLMQDIIEIYESNEYDDELEKIVHELMVENEGNREAKVNIEFHYSMRLFNAGKFASAFEMLRDASKVAQAISRDHPALPGICAMLGELKKRGNARTFRVSEG